MKTAILKFNDLTALASYSKTIHLKGYRMNISDLTLAASLTTFELAIAVEQYGASLITENEAVLQ